MIWWHWSHDKKGEKGGGEKNREREEEEKGEKGEKACLPVWDPASTGVCEAAGESERRDALAFWTATTSRCRQNGLASQWGQKRRCPGKSEGGFEVKTVNRNCSCWKGGEKHGSTTRLVDAINLL
jgi:hypothetical protein